MTWKAILASGLLVVAAYAANYGLDGCERRPDNPPSFVPMMQAGDGVHIVGDEIRPGLWEAPDNWREQPNCAWFVSPAAMPSPSASPTVEPSSIRARVETPEGGGLTIRLHHGEGFTSSGCATPGHLWQHISD